MHRGQHFGFPFDASSSFSRRGFADANNANSMIELIQQFRGFKPYLKRRLETIQKSGKVLEMREEISEIKLYLNVMEDVLADDNHGPDQIRSFIDKIHEMIRVNPMTSELPGNRRRSVDQDIDEFGDDDRPRSPSPGPMGSSSESAASHIPLVSSHDAHRVVEVDFTIGGDNSPEVDEWGKPLHEATYTRREPYQDVDMRRGGYYQTNAIGRGQPPQSNRRWSGDTDSNNMRSGRGPIGRGMPPQHHHRDGYDSRMNHNQSFGPDQDPFYRNEAYFLDPNPQEPPRPARNVKQPSWMLDQPEQSPNNMNEPHSRQHGMDNRQNWDAGGGMGYDRRPRESHRDDEWHRSHSEARARHEKYTQQLNKFVDRRPKSETRGHDNRDDFGGRDRARDMPSQGLGHRDSFPGVRPPFTHQPPPPHPPPMHMAHPPPPRPGYGYGQHVPFNPGPGLLPTPAMSYQSPPPHAPSQPLPQGMQRSMGFQQPPPKAPPGPPVNSFARHEMPPAPVQYHIPPPQMPPAPRPMHPLSPVDSYGHTGHGYNANSTDDPDKVRQISARLAKQCFTRRPATSTSSNQTLSGPTSPGPTSPGGNSPSHDPRLNRMGKQGYPQHPPVARVTLQPSPPQSSNSIRRPNTTDAGNVLKISANDPRYKHRVDQEKRSLEEKRERVRQQEAARHVTNKPSKLQEFRKQIEKEGFHRLGRPPPGKKQSGSFEDALASCDNEPEPGSSKEKSKSPTRKEKEESRSHSNKTESDKSSKHGDKNKTKDRSRSPSKPSSSSSSAEGKTTGKDGGDKSSRKKSERVEKAEKSKSKKSTSPKPPQSSSPKSKGKASVVLPEPVNKLSGFKIPRKPKPKVDEVIPVDNVEKDVCMSPPASPEPALSQVTDVDNRGDESEAATSSKSTTAKPSSSSSTDADPDPATLNFLRQFLASSVAEADQDFLTNEDKLKEIFFKIKSGISSASSKSNEEKTTAPDKAEELDKDKGPPDEDQQERGRSREKKRNTKRRSSLEKLHDALKEMRFDTMLPLGPRRCTRGGQDESSENNDSNEAPASVASDDMASSSSALSSAPPKTAEDSQETNPRRRGRPPKEPVKKGRKASPKKAQEETVETVPEDSDSNSTINPEPLFAPAPPRRGRKKKVKRKVVLRKRGKKAKVGPVTRAQAAMKKNLRSTLALVGEWDNVTQDNDTRKGKTSGTMLRRTTRVRVGARDTVVQADLRKVKQERAEAAGVATQSPAAIKAELAQQMKREHFMEQDPFLNPTEAFFGMTSSDPSNVASQLADFIEDLDHDTVADMDGQTEDAMDLDVFNALDAVGDSDDQVGTVFVKDEELSLTIDENDVADDLSFEMIVNKCQLPMRKTRRSGNSVLPPVASPLGNNVVSSLNASTAPEPLDNSSAGAPIDLNSCQSETQTLPQAGNSTDDMSCSAGPTAANIEQSTQSSANITITEKVQKPSHLSNNDSHTAGPSIIIAPSQSINLPPPPPPSPFVSTLQDADRTPASNQNEPSSVETQIQRPPPTAPTGEKSSEPEIQGRVEAAPGTNHPLNATPPPPIPPVMIPPPSPRESVEDLPPMKLDPDVKVEPVEDDTRKDVHKCEQCNYSGKNIVKHYVNKHYPCHIPQARLMPETFEGLIELNTSESPQLLEIVLDENQHPIWPCLYCDDRHDSIVDFYDHLTSHTGEYRYECAECGLTYCQLKSLQNHAKQHKGMAKSCVRIVPDTITDKECKDLSGFLCNDCYYFQLRFENIMRHIEGTEHSAMDVKSVKLICPSALNQVEPPEDVKVAPAFDLPTIMPKADESLQIQKPEAVIAAPSEDDSMDPGVFFGTDVNFTAPSISIMDCTTVIEPPAFGSRFLDNLMKRVCDKVESNEMMESSDTNEAQGQPGTRKRKRSDSLLDEDTEDESKTDASEGNTTTKETQDGSGAIRRRPNMRTTCSSRAHKMIKWEPSEERDTLSDEPNDFFVSSDDESSDDSEEDDSDDEDMPNVDGETDIKRQIVPKKEKVEVEVRTGEVRNNEHLVKTRANVEQDKYDERLMSYSHVVIVRRPGDFHTPNAVVYGFNKVNAGINPTPKMRDMKEGERLDSFCGRRVHAIKSYLRLKEMMTTTKLTHFFKCMGTYCSYTTDSPQEFLQHLNIRHNRLEKPDCARFFEANDIRRFKDSDNCCYCTASYRDPKDLIEHVMVQHGQSVFQCNRCFYRSFYHRYVVRHFDMMHPDEYTQVLKCHKKNDIPSQEATLFQIFVYKCDIDNPDCDKTRRFVFREDFLEHLSSCVPFRDLYPCHLCKESVPLNKIVEHYKLHNLFKFHCSYCQFGSEVKTDLDEHFVQVHPNTSGRVFYRVKPTATNHVQSVVVSLNPYKPRKSKHHAPPPEPEPSPQNSICSEKEQQVSDITGSENSGMDVSENEESEKGRVTNLTGHDLYRCVTGGCDFTTGDSDKFKEHVGSCPHVTESRSLSCAHCERKLKTVTNLLEHLKVHGEKKQLCSLCSFRCWTSTEVTKHVKTVHRVMSYKLLRNEATETDPDPDMVVFPKDVAAKAICTVENFQNNYYTFARRAVYSYQNIDKLPFCKVFSSDLHCALCPYATKVRSNIIRHLQIHKLALEDGKTVVPQAPRINPVPYLSREGLEFDKMMNLAASSHKTNGGTAPEDDVRKLPQFVKEQFRYVCSVCDHITSDDALLQTHIRVIHSEVSIYRCPHCQKNPETRNNPEFTVSLDKIPQHLRLHGPKLFKCGHCTVVHHQLRLMEKHIPEKHPEKKPIHYLIRDVDPDGIPSARPTTSGMSRRQSADDPKQASTEKWKCFLCSSKTAFGSWLETKSHCETVHKVTSQFRCLECDFTSDDVTEMLSHCQYSCQSDRKNQILVLFSKCETFDAEDSSVTLPVWKRHGGAVRHIHGNFTEDSVALIKQYNSQQGTGGESLGPANASPLRGSMALPVPTNKPPLKPQTQAKARRSVGNSPAKCAPTPPKIQILSLPPLPPPPKQEVFKYHCHKCDLYKTKNPNELRVHLFNEFRYKRWKCLICFTTFTTEKSLKGHIERDHQKLYQQEFFELQPENFEIEAEINECIEKQNRKREMINSFAVESEGKLTCKNCNVDGLTYETFETHILQKHSG